MFPPRCFFQQQRQRHGLYGNGYYLGVDASYTVFIWTQMAPPPWLRRSTTSHLKSTTAIGTKWPFRNQRNFSRYLRGRKSAGLWHFRHLIFRHYCNRQRFWRVAWLDAILILPEMHLRALPPPRFFPPSGRQYRNPDPPGATSDPNDGTWRPGSRPRRNAVVVSDSDAVNWRSDIMASTTIATSTDTVLKMEGTGSLKIEWAKPALPLAPSPFGILKKRDEHRHISLRRNGE